LMDEGVFLNDILDDLSLDSISDEQKLLSSTSPFFLTVPTVNGAIKTGGSPYSSESGYSECESSPSPYSYPDNYSDDNFGATDDLFPNLMQID